MREINEYIESNLKYLNELKTREARSEDEKEKIERLITIYSNYIDGLQDAKKYILKEMKQYIEEEEKKEV